MKADSQVVNSVEELREFLKSHRNSQKEIGRVELRSQDSKLSYSPEDMTIKVMSGIRLDELQSTVSAEGQWLPIDPCDDRISIKHLLDENLYGPHRYGFGTIREHLIGMEIILPDGRLVESGGNVVKNVAGYDLQKVFIGARQSLGIIVSATFKLLPKPAHRAFLKSGPLPLSEAAQLTEAVLETPVEPVVIDWAGESNNINIVLGFAGPTDAVEWQLSQLDKAQWQRTNLKSHDAAYFGGAGEWHRRRSILPSQLAEIIRDLDGKEFIARAGNGIVWSPAFAPTKSQMGKSLIEQRLKITFDPVGILPGIDR